MMPKLTESQQRALTNLAEGRHIAWGIYGRSAHGGMTQTIYALHKRGYLDKQGDITPAGRAAIGGQADE